MPYSLGEQVVDMYVIKGVESYLPCLDVSDESHISQSAELVGNGRACSPGYCSNIAYAKFFFLAKGIDDLCPGGIAHGPESFRQMLKKTLCFHFLFYRSDLVFFNKTATVSHTSLDFHKYLHVNNCSIVCKDK